jgi:hypothetical protein
MPRRPCLGVGGKRCGLLAEGTRCEGCKRERERQRGSRQQRGYDQGHVRTREALLPGAYGRPCPRCGLPMLVGQALDLGHSVDLRVDPRARGDRIEHASCNRADRTPHVRNSA